VAGSWAPINALPTDSVLACLPRAGSLAAGLLASRALATCMPSAGNGSLTPLMTAGSMITKSASSSRLVPRTTEMGAPDGDTLILPSFSSLYGTLGNPTAVPSTTAAKPTTGAIGGRTIGQRAERLPVRFITASMAAACSAVRWCHAAIDGGATLGCACAGHALCQRALCDGRVAPGERAAL
jgi:hypothetical protein